MSESFCVGQSWPSRFDYEPILVFGSRFSGEHDVGDALLARCFYGARDGISVGPTGSAWAIPVGDAVSTPLPSDLVIRHLHHFFEAARLRYADVSFQLSRIGFRESIGDDPEIRRFCIQHAPPNVELPGIWQSTRDPGRVCLLVAGSRSCKNPEKTQSRVESRLKSLLAEIGPFEVATGDFTGVESFAVQFAQGNGLIHHVIPLEREFESDWSMGCSHPPGLLELRNAMLLWYGTHFFLEFDPEHESYFSSFANRARENGLMPL